MQFYQLYFCPFVTEKSTRMFKIKFKNEYFAHERKGHTSTNFLYEIPYDHKKHRE